MCRFCSCESLRDQKAEFHRPFKTDSLKTSTCVVGSSALGNRISSFKSERPSMAHSVSPNFRRAIAFRAAAIPQYPHRIRAHGNICVCLLMQSAVRYHQRHYKLCQSPDPTARLLIATASAFFCGGTVPARLTALKHCQC